MTNLIEQDRNASQWLDELSDAIAEEAEALVSADADALLEAVARKERAAEALVNVNEAEASKLDPIKVSALREANLANAALMQAAQAHACWTLKQLGRLESTPTYTGHGRSQPLTVPRYYGAA